MHALVEHLRQEVPALLEHTSLRRGEITLTTAPATLVPLLHYLRDHTGTRMRVLVDLTAVDYPEREQRFQVVYHLLSVDYATRVRVTTALGESETLPSVTGLYSSAGWWEREVWDMFGIFFTGHPDLRRILTDYGFQGHPLRKDYPLTGYSEVRYCDGEKRVVTEPVELAQEFRYFSHQSPWERLPQEESPGSLYTIINKIKQAPQGASQSPGAPRLQTPPRPGIGEETPSIQDP